jgi:hypothetical protein
MTPFFALGFGYDLHILKQVYYGTTFMNSLIANPSLGVRVAVTKKFAMSAGVGYKLLLMHYTALSSNGTPQGEYTLEHGMTFKVGFHF